MNGAWLLATLALLPPLIVGLAACARGGADRRLVALQLTTSLATLLFVAMSFAFDQPSSIDLALAFSLVSSVGTLSFALFHERWL